MALAPLGGWGTVDFDVLADLAVQFAPAGADSRAAVLSAIGRGIGRAAVHEAGAPDTRSAADSQQR